MSEVDGRRRSRKCTDSECTSLQDTSLRPAITLDEGEIADSLGTFYVFDKENNSGSAKA